MLVLLSFGLVLVATVLLVLGLLTDDGLTLIYFSIGLSALAAVVLIAAVRFNRPRAAAPAAPEPLPEPLPEGARDRAPERELVGAGAAPAGAAPAGAGAGTGEWLASDDGWEDDAGAGDTGDDWEDEFPIAEYDDLRVAEIMPLLPQLYSDELDVVEERERAGRNRTTILNAIADLRVAATEDTTAAEAGAGTARLGADAGREVEDEADWEEDESTGAVFPIDDYDDLAVSEILGVLGELDREELAVVRAHEAAGRNRRTILLNIDRRLGAEPAPAKKAAATRKAAPSKAATPPKKAASSARKAPATKAAATKRTAPASKKAAPAKAATPPKKAAPTKAAAASKSAAPSKKAAPARKAATKAAPAKKAAPTKSAAPAKKAARTKAAAPVKKAAPARKAAATKSAAPAKKAAAKRTAARKR